MLILAGGKYSPAELMVKSEFLLAPRGDFPTSRRLYEAMAYGAIPVLMADDIFAVGIPFQCFIP